MRPKVIVGIVVIVAGFILASVNFVRSNVEYGDFAGAEKTGKLIQVKGAWLKEKESRFDADHAQFIFYMVDDNGRQMRIVLDGAKPNNFELATSIVARGKMEQGYFHATDVLTKCPSKYEGDAESVKKTL
ncbi:MAG TPA: cytochrome c maturation protein CcmE [Bacteroidota bacterium]|nr:cytochrome c maturation protein CcmE [Bacteroidota bacterium]